MHQNLREIYDKARDIASVLNKLSELIQLRMGYERFQNCKYGCRYQVQQSDIK
jgi:hypothetical protein